MTISIAPALLRTRIAVIDVMRGLVMLIMLFDHVRETVFLHHQEIGRASCRERVF